MIETTEQRNERQLAAMRARLYAPSMVEMIFRVAERDPKRLCVADPEEFLDYGGFKNRILEKASILRGMGVCPGDRIVALAAQRADFLALHFAVHLAGAVFVPLGRELPETRVKEVAEKVGARFVLTESRLSGECAPFTPVFPKEESPATILYTTGTTGTSKGIELSHRAEVAVAQNVFYGTEMEPDTIELIPMPVHHSYGLRHCFGLFLGGRSIVLCDGVAMADTVFDLMDRYRVNALSLTPAALMVLTTLTGERLATYAHSIRYLQLGTAGVDATVKEKMRRMLPHSRLYQYYSSTEAGCACIFDYRNDKSPRRVGRPACNSHFVIMDDEGNPIESSAERWGFIACAGPMNMTGYYGEPELTAATMQNGFVRSQDIGYIDEEGYLCFVCRSGDVINTAGYKVAPEEVEAVALRYEGIRECACSGVDDPLYGQVPKLYVVPEDADTFDTAALYRHLQRELEPWKLPHGIELICAVPRNYMGKMQRKLCEQAVRLIPSGGKETHGTH
ncbi:MAG: class I adenylate-forming enzyme family protein [Clostridia bacterium]|nr:class I adenylate-forming enzyme family protein [Clostridia bacterium]